MNMCPVIQNNYAALKSLMPGQIEFRYEVSQRDRVKAAREYETAVTAYKAEVDREKLIHKKNIARLYSLHNAIEERYEILQGCSDNMKMIMERSAGNSCFSSYQKIFRDIFVN